MKKLLKKLLTGGSAKAPVERKSPAPSTKRAIWRISESAPMGEWVDPDAAPEPVATSRRPAPDPASTGWTESSMDLLNGADVSEDHDTTPAELFDDVNARRRSSPKRS